MSFIHSNKWIHLTSRLALGTLLLAGSPLFADPISGDGTGDDSTRGAHPVDQGAQLSPRGAQGGAKAKALPARFPMTHNLDFTREGLPALCAETTTIDGLSEAEASHTWSNAKEVRIEFARNLPEDFILKLTAKAFGPNVMDEEGPIWPCLFGLSTDKSQQYTFTLASEMSQKVFIFSGVEPTSTLTFRVPNPVSSEELGLGSDTRKLGLGLERITIEDLGENLLMARGLKTFRLLVDIGDAEFFGELVNNWDETDDALVGFLYGISYFSPQDRRHRAPEVNCALRKYSLGAIKQFAQIVKPRLAQRKENPELRRIVQELSLGVIEKLPEETSPDGVLRAVSEALAAEINLD